MDDVQKNNPASTDNTVSETVQGTNAPVAPSDDSAGAPAINDAVSLPAEESTEIEGGVPAQESASTIPTAAPSIDVNSVPIEQEEPDEVVQNETSSTVAGDAPQAENARETSDRLPSENSAGTVIERVVEKIVPAEITESDKDKIFTDRLRTMAPAAIAAKQRKHAERLQTIVAHLHQHGYITNDEVERLCRVANSTAAKYLAELKKRETITQLGKTGRKVRYRLREAIS